MKHGALPFAVILAAFAIGLLHCSSSSSEPSTFGPDAGADARPDGSAPLSTPADHFAAGSSCRKTRPVSSAGNPTGDAGPACDADAGYYCSCITDADCAAGTNGRCYASSGFGSSCNYDDCFSSSDCASGTTCACGDRLPVSANQCVPSNCRVDTDCGENGFCSPSLQDACDRSESYAGAYCHTAQDDCNNDSDCEAPGKKCIFSSEAAKWTCTEIICGAG